MGKRGGVLMANKKKLVVTPLTRTIWWTTVNESKGMIVGNNKVDVTDNAIESVLDHFILDDNFANKGFSGYTYKKKDGNEVTICGFDERHIAINSELWKEAKTKAEELDRREKGVAVTFSHFEVFAYTTKDYYTCSNCKRDDVMEDTEYCPRCGCRIDWNEVT
jgi:hypothetical protein